MSNADVACRELGYGPAISPIRRSYGKGAGPILMDDVVCRGREKTMRQRSDPRSRPDDDMPSFFFFFFLELVAIRRSTIAATRKTSAYDAADACPAPKKRVRLLVLSVFCICGLLAFLYSLIPRSYCALLVPYDRSAKPE